MVLQYCKEPQFSIFQDVTLEWAELSVNCLKSFSTSNIYVHRPAYSRRQVDRADRRSGTDNPEPPALGNYWLEPRYRSSGPPHLNHGRGLTIYLLRCQVRNLYLRNVDFGWVGDVESRNATLNSKASRLPSEAWNHGLCPMLLPVGAGKLKLATSLVNGIIPLY